MGWCFSASVSSFVKWGFEGQTPPSGGWLKGLRKHPALGGRTQGGGWRRSPLALPSTRLLTPPRPVLLQDLAMYINEVKRDKETLKKISEFQSSIENLVSAAGPPRGGGQRGVLKMPSRSHYRMRRSESVPVRPGPGSRDPRRVPASAVPGAQGAGCSQAGQPKGGWYQPPCPPSLACTEDALRSKRPWLPGGRWSVLAHAAQELPSGLPMPVGIGQAGLPPHGTLRGSPLGTGERSWAIQGADRHVHARVPQ